MLKSYFLSTSSWNFLHLSIPVLRTILSDDLSFYINILKEWFYGGFLGNPIQQQKISNPTCFVASSPFIPPIASIIQLYVEIYNFSTKLCIIPTHITSLFEHLLYLMTKNLVQNHERWWLITFPLSPHPENLKYLFFSLTHIFMGFLMVNGVVKYFMYILSIFLMIK